MNKFRRLWFFVLLATVGPAARAHEVKPVNFSDKVFKIQEQDARVRVLFKQHAGVYYLSKDNPHYKDLLAVLQASLRQNDSVNVAADPTALTIQTASKD